MKATALYKYYSVNSNESAVTEVSWNDFQIPVFSKKPRHPESWSLPPGKEMFYGCPGLVQAMEKAKVEALNCINRLLKSGPAGLPELLKFRIAHYEDLNVNLTDRNIRKIEALLVADPTYVWKPFKITNG